MIGLSSGICKTGGDPFSEEENLIVLTGGK